jgi:kynurenine formamidase
MGARTLDEIPVRQLILPLMVIDISAKVARSPDAVPVVADAEAWETRSGRGHRHACWRRAAEGDHHNEDEPAAGQESKRLTQNARLTRGVISRPSGGKAVRSIHVNGGSVF